MTAQKELARRLNRYGVAFGVLGFVCVLADLSEIKIATFLIVGWFTLMFSAWLEAKQEDDAAELRGLSNRRVMELTRTDAENAAGMVS